MNMFDSVLVTGCGGDIGQGICRILKMSNFAKKVIGCDIHEDHIGPLLFDVCEHIVRSGDEDYFLALRKILNKHNIDLIIPTSEAEIANFIKHGYSRSFGNTPILLVDANSIRIGLDKMETVNFLKTHGLDYPWTNVVEESNPREIPCVLKMRSGQGSKNFVKVMDKQLVPHYKKTRPLDLWQELLLPENEEYTCGVYRANNGEIRTIIIRRKLLEGVTVSGITVHSDSISQYLRKIAVALDLHGSINIQLKHTERGPVVFEINPRFSSTVVFRHLLGFQDLFWLLSELKNIPLKPYQETKKDIRIYRGIHECIIEDT